MRFEWLLIGYLLMFQIPAGEITILPFLGFLIMEFAMLRLSKFEEAFGKAKKVLYGAIPAGLLLLILQICRIRFGDAVPGWYVPVYFSARLLCECAEMFTLFFIYIGVKTIGTKAELPAFEKRAGRNMAIMFVYFSLETVMTVISSFFPRLLEGIEIIRIYPFIVGFIWRVLNSWMILACYLGVAIDDETEEEKNARAAQKRKEDAERRRTARNKKRKK